MSACVLPHDDRTEAETGLLCRKHRRALDDLTTEIGLLIVDTCRIVDGGAPSEASPQTRHLKQPEAPAPGDLSIMALYDSRTRQARIEPRPPTHRLGWSEGDSSEPMAPVLAMIAANLLLVAEERPLTETRTRLVIRCNRIIGWQAYTAPMRLPGSVLGQLEVLARHHDWIAEQMWCDVYHDELREIRTYLRSVVNDRTHTRVGTCDLPIEGGTCGGPLLVANGSSVIKCGRCRAEWVTAVQQARLAVRLG